MAGPLLLDRVIVSTEDPSPMAIALTGFWYPHPFPTMPEMVTLTTRGSQSLGAPSALVGLLPLLLTLL